MYVISLPGHLIAGGEVNFVALIVRGTQKCGGWTDDTDMNVFKSSFRNIDLNDCGLYVSTYICFFKFCLSIELFVHIWSKMRCVNESTLSFMSMLR